VTIWSKSRFVVDFRNLLFGRDFDLSFSKSYSHEIFQLVSGFYGKMRHLNSDPGAPVRFWNGPPTPNEKRCTSAWFWEDPRGPPWKPGKGVGAGAGTLRVVPKSLVTTKFLLLI
jgi:hypothetical protein